MKISNSMKGEREHPHCNSQYSGFLVGLYSHAQGHPFPAQQKIFVPATKIFCPTGCDHLLLCKNVLSVSQNVLKYFMSLSFFRLK